ncbi:MAG: hypothetical protein C7B46_01050 [Sulfobacillus benefaciens]|uniref:Uncharacterized protein n=1 Tax=Sulfobacillus benefaciens TaxID=453960 RepID=A0A2T2XLA8_9FIRM|nr:MAG: hypothetical protein C7B46_01050 [Sulfobacillus benefaciens]
MKPVVTLIVSLFVIALAVWHIMEPFPATNQSARTQSIRTIHSVSGPMVPALTGLPHMSRHMLDQLAAQGLVYGLAGKNRSGDPDILLFISRLPNTPTHLTINHWPSWRFAPIAQGPSLNVLLGSPHRPVHWLHLGAAVNFKK